MERMGEKDVSQFLEWISSGGKWALYTADFQDITLLSQDCL
jgi:hypothetical protein